MRSATSGGITTAYSHLYQFGVIVPLVVSFASFVRSALSAAEADFAAHDAAHARALAEAAAAKAGAEAKAGEVRRSAAARAGSACWRLRCASLRCAGHAPRRCVPQAVAGAVAARSLACAGGAKPGGGGGGAAASAADDRGAGRAHQGARVGRCRARSAAPDMLALSIILGSADRLPPHPLPAM
jgi:hypothetical protein